MLVKISKLYVYLVFGAVSFIMLLMSFSVLPFSRILFLRIVLHHAHDNYFGIYFS